MVQIRQVFGEKTEEQNQQAALNEHYGEVTVAIQQFKGIPMQIKASDSQHEKRFALPEYFIKGIAAAQKEDDNVVLLRKWKDYGVRYGEMEDIVKEVADELVAAYPEERINRLVAAAQEMVDTKEAILKRPKIKLTAEMLNDESWEKRYQAIRTNGRSNG